TSAIGTKRRRSNPLAMSLKPCEKHSRVCVPHPRRFIPRRGDDAKPIRAKRRGFDRPSVAYQLDNGRTRRSVPHPRGAVVRSGDDTGPIETERRGCKVSMTFQRGARSSYCDIPYPGGVSVVINNAGSIRAERHP